MQVAAALTLACSSRAHLATARRRQDEDLDDLSGAVARLGNVGLTIGEELDAQVPFVTRDA
jgi:hypothetical protein